jgi:dTDP-4-amino-4,6-dideoxygalactose transaminase
MNFNIRIWRDHGQSERYIHVSPDGWNERIMLPFKPKGQKHLYHLFVVHLPDREKAREALSRLGIGVGLHYPIPLHLQQAYSALGYRKGDFPECETAASSILSLPMFPHITEEQVDHVCRCLKEIL